MSTPDEVRELGKLLTIAARLTRSEMTTDLLDFYMHALEPHGLAEACRAIRVLLENPRYFPTIVEIKEAMGIGAKDPKARATALAHDVWRELERGVSKFTEQRASPEANALAARLGGWQRLSDCTTIDGKQAFIAQWRDTAVSMLPAFDRQKLAAADARPELSCHLDALKPH